MQSRPLKASNNVPMRELVHTYDQKNIHLRDVVSFAEKRFDAAKLSTTYLNLRDNFEIPKKRAQRMLKRALQKQLVFAPQNKKPQEYYPVSRQFEVTEHLDRKNVLIDTTGTSPFKSPLSSSIEQQKASNFLQSLLFAKYISHQIHKLQLEFTIDKKKLLEKDYYERITTKVWQQNKGKVVEDFIDERKVTFTYYKNCKIAIW